MALGRWDVDTLLAEMPSHVFTEWMAYYGIEPFGDEVIDVHLANITAILANQNRKKSDRPIKTDDVRLWKQVKKPFDPNEFFEGLKGMFRRST